MTTAAVNAKTLDETDVGISCFVSDTPGFRGVLKQRYSDFIVNEVDRDGNIVHLTCLDPPLEEVHNFFKKNFKFLITDTVEVPGSDLKCVRVRYSSSGEKGRGGRKRKDRGESNKPFDSRGSDDWPDHLGKFLIFTLYKENKDTQEALGLIGKMLGIQVTVFKQHAERLAALNKRLIGIKVGDFCYVREGLVLGQLLGNHFTITLRGVVAESDDILKAAADGLGKGGFINYYGLQRAAIQEAREYYKEVGNIDVTLRKLPRHLVAERAIYERGVIACGNIKVLGLRQLGHVFIVSEYLAEKIPTLFTLFSQERFQVLIMHFKGVTKVALGDLVYCKGSSQETIAEVVNDDPGVDSIDTCDDSGLPEFSEASIPEERIVKVISAEDLAVGIYTVDDVVLPLPGEFSITSMTGGYRRVFQRPMDYEWELLTYTDCNVSLAESDMDVIAKASSTDSIKENDLSIENNDSSSFNSMEQSGTSVNTGENSSNNENGADGPVNPQYPQVALKLGFTLPSSCYATMAIRELLKSSTSFEIH
ncbi:hypothetical protein QJS10_CPA08g00310 [Acorus calamus]|uniref:TRUD domain-containing protein n=1 Tax=Acorus calamus TaxID=4465 RepID=A0AAV9ECS9_ACOCL|nr:hypothetical protein QJS10_CPA08g00310 [Acorus calamus]